MASDKERLGDKHVFVLPYTQYEIAMIGWVLGALFSLLFPFYLKVRDGQLTWADFNIGYLINFVITLGTGVMVSLLVFSIWIIPEGSQIVVLVIAFLTSAGFDDTVMKQVLKLLGVYEGIWVRLKS